MDNIKSIMEQELTNRVAIFKNIFSTRLKELREERKLSQKSVANKLGYAVSTYANWEQGRTEPSISDIYNLLWIFNIEPNDLFDIN